MSEIQTAGEFVEGWLKNWSWVEGQDNPADWTTKPWQARELAEGGFWLTGPNFLRKEVKE